MLLKKLKADVRASGTLKFGYEGVFMIHNLLENTGTMHRMSITF